MTYKIPKKLEWLHAFYQRYTGGDDSGILPQECISWPWGLDKDNRCSLRYKGTVYAVADILASWNVDLVANTDYPLGNIPSSHMCGNPVCVNPDHILQGGDGIEYTNAPVADYVDNKRRRDKIGPLDVPTIRQRYLDGDTQEKIAADYGVSRQCISSLLVGRTWGHVA